jgi:hypothetical protein
MGARPIILLPERRPRRLLTGEAPQQRGRLAQVTGGDPEAGQLDLGDRGAGGDHERLGRRHPVRLVVGPVGVEPVLAVVGPQLAQESGGRWREAAKRGHRGPPGGVDTAMIIVHELSAETATGGSDARAPWRPQAEPPGGVLWQARTFLPRVRGLC